ncbi:MAG: hypothetical protein Q8R38_02485 [Candidatus Omnitrophota bacterium]|nr:hypothetical protein [Candidatus Omnitrophota bacterium]
MDFVSMKTQIKNAGLDNIRTDNDDYLEAVIKRESIDNIIQALESVFGKPAWPSKDKLSSPVQKLVNDYGGLRKGQTLFSINGDGVLVFAMLWPWQDGERITLKMGKA